MIFELAIMFENRLHRTLAIIFIGVVVAFFAAKFDQPEMAVGIFFMCLAAAGLMKD